MPTLVIAQTACHWALTASLPCPCSPCSAPRESQGTRTHQRGLRGPGDMLCWATGQALAGCHKAAGKRAGHKYLQCRSHQINSLSPTPQTSQDPSRKDCEKQQPFPGHHPGKPVTVRRWREPLLREITLQTGPAFHLTLRRYDHVTRPVCTLGTGVLWGRSVSTPEPSRVCAHRRHSKRGWMDAGGSEAYWAETCS